MKKLMAFAMLAAFTAFFAAHSQTPIGSSSGYFSTKKGGAATFPAPPNLSVQWNNNFSQFGGDATFIFEPTIHRLTVPIRVRQTIVHFGNLASYSTPLVAGETLYCVDCTVTSSTDDTCTNAQYQYDNTGGAPGTGAYVHAIHYIGNGGAGSGDTIVFTCSL